MPGGGGEEVNSQPLVLQLRLAARGHTHLAGGPAAARAKQDAKQRTPTRRRPSSSRLQPGVAADGDEAHPGIVGDSQDELAALAAPPSAVRTASHPCASDGPGCAASSVGHIQAPPPPPSAPLRAPQRPSFRAGAAPGGFTRSSRLKHLVMQSCALGPGTSGAAKGTTGTAIQEARACRRLGMPMVAAALSLPPAAPPAPTSAPPPPPVPLAPPPTSAARAPPSGRSPSPLRQQALNGGTPGASSGRARAVLQPL